MKPCNLHIAHDLDSSLCPLPQHCSVHATYGDYTEDTNDIVPATLASFQYIADRPALARPNDIFLVGVRSDYAIELENLRKGFAHARPMPWEPQETRALKIGEAIALQHPDRKIVVATYNDAEEFFSKLRFDMNCNLYSLHQTFSSERIPPRVVGINYFAMSFGFEVPNKINTSDEMSLDMAAEIMLVDLTKRIGDKGPYITNTGKIVFSPRHESLVPHSHIHELKQPFESKHPQPQQP